MRKMWWLLFVAVLIASVLFAANLQSTEPPAEAQAPTLRPMLIGYIAPEEFEAVNAEGVTPPIPLCGPRRFKVEVPVNAVVTKREGGKQ